MPIVVEEEKSRRARFITVVSVLGVIGLLVFMVYSIFIKEADITPYQPNESFRRIQELSKITISAGDITGDANFKFLTTYITPEPPNNIGRANPFIAYDGYVIASPGPKTLAPIVPPAPPVQQLFFP